MIDLPEGDLAKVLGILRRHSPDHEVRAFGSRVHGTARRYSDLDLALFGPAAVPEAVLDSLKDAFAESDLPISVDVMDWRALPAGLRAEIGDRFLVLQRGGREIQRSEMK